MIRTLVCALVLFMLPAAAAPAQAQPQDRPNIVMIVPEGYSFRLHSFGDPVAVTPNLDALAAQGVRYTNAFATSPVCAPSRAALLTGMQAISFGAQHMRSYVGGYQPVPPPEVKAFPELLRAAGYYTYTTGKADYQFSGIKGPFTIWDKQWSNDSDGQNWPR